MSRKIRVVIAEDHPLFREGLKQVLNSENDIEVVGEAENGKKLLSLLRKVSCDMVLLDERMPVMDGWQTLPKLRTEYRTIKVIMLTISNDRDNVEYFLSQGASAFLDKNSRLEKLLDTIYSVHKNVYCLPEGYTEEIFTLKVNERTKPRVSARELEVLEAFSDGLTEKQTAEKLNISQHTVHSHRMNMIIKTKSNNIAKLIKYAFTNHWFNP